MSVDERALGALLEESNDLQSGAMRSIREPLRELVERGQERPAHGGLDPDEQRQVTTEHAGRSQTLQPMPIGVAAAGSSRSRPRE